MKSPAIQIPDGCTEVLLHACCAPCSSAIVEWLLSHKVRPTIFYFNPNIWPREEYEIRKQESKRHAEGLRIRWIDGDYDHDGWRCEVRGLEDEPERGCRCEQCFTLRLTATAQKAKELGIRYFATTLASSRWKSLEQIERAGHLAEQAVEGVTFWAQNWRKGGLQERCNQLLKEYNFYNQQYCGCEFSARQAVLTKDQLRKQMREAKCQHQNQLASMSAMIVESLKGRLADCRVVMAYWPLPDEVDIRPLLMQLVTEGKMVLLPKVLDSETMELRRFTSTADLAEGPLHILEPVGKAFTDYEKIDIVLAPGMAFDAAGHRLGRGKGYYDRFLSTHFSTLAPKSLPLLVGVCFPFQRVPQVPSEPHDICMDV
jgi:5,10-methenyltetrahydrofolate synthetase